MDDEAVIGRPVLFSGPMVRALLEGRKAQTRRTIKGVPSWQHYGKDIMDWSLSGIHQYDDELAGTDKWFLDVQTDVDDHSREIIKCPYGQPGDVLWVRETVALGENDKREKIVIGYSADVTGRNLHWDKTEAPRWTPSIHMSRWASRLTLEITEVRVQRLHDISEEDALAEGIEPRYWLGQSTPLLAVASFRGSWESVNGPESWAQNPWTWALTFKVHHQNIDDFLQMRGGGMTEAENILKMIEQ
jgi:hypothetical protein